MDFTPPGRLKTAEAFAATLRSLAPHLDCPLVPAGADGPLAQPIDVYGRTIGNRFAVHPMEGWDGTTNGLPTDHTLRRWRRFGESGAKLIWGGEAFAVQRDGRANANQLYLEPAADTAGGLHALRSALLEGHAAVGCSPDDLFIGLQLTHSGRFARPDGSAAPLIAHRHPPLAEKYALSPDVEPLTDGALEAIGANFVRSALLARSVGFDFVDVKCCHGYLLHEMLGCHERPGPYGGTFENRTRLFRRIVEGIRTACPDLSIGVRVSIADTVPFVPGPEARRGIPGVRDAHLPYRFGFGVDASNPLEQDMSEPIRFLELLRDLGIRLVNITFGSPYYNPHLQRPAAYPPSDGYMPPEDPLLGVVKHLDLVRVCKAAVPELAYVGSGYSYLQEYLPHVAEAEVGGGHADFVGLGRMILSYPGLPRDVLAGKSLDRKLICRTFSDCTTAPRNGMISGCFPLDGYYGTMPQAVELRTIKKRLRSENTT
ncbi:MAG: oxidoreductase [Planctomycetota bacterium]